MNKESCATPNHGADPLTTSPASQRSGEGRSRAGGERYPLGLTPEIARKGAHAASVARQQKSVAARLLELAHATPGSFSAKHAIASLQAKPLTVMTTLSQLKREGFLQRVGVEKGLDGQYALSEELRGRAPQKRMQPVIERRDATYVIGSQFPLRHHGAPVAGQHLTADAFFADKPQLPPCRRPTLSDRGGNNA